jgi:hypothetical protein
MQIFLRGIASGGICTASAYTNTVYLFEGESVNKKMSTLLPNSYRTKITTSAVSLIYQLNYQ